MNPIYLEPTNESAMTLFSRDIKGEVVMLNLLLFKEFADYSKYPDLKPAEKISGWEAYQKYMDHTKPLLEQSGGEIVFLGAGGGLFIGPSDKYWDVVMLVRQKSVQSFVDFASNKEYLKGIGHRVAALKDSRLLPMVEIEDGDLMKFAV